ncbi:ankyrin repeat, SAM and basic leucine zipper domain-containing protein 1-like isoform X2 [Sinocyclocheilus grahami]|uniref:ankyrin repeat, SAM and basic leucine zipper domain-containing protein 1-like isoform X2 n=1 Tax=Sinocyclocheilus grahami TaxID=75366 RepID=UPI0007ACB07A|nr:PREDICTED: ankyrin repeat, SAM and basic leucine zipper domain-containing protein 1-like isoform X2 [Sinocyclocheilus grahami]
MPFLQAMKVMGVATSGTLDILFSEAHPNGEDKVFTLKRAITTGNVDLVRELLDSGLDVETRLGFGWTPLMCAAHVAHYELAELLLDHGASANFSRDHYTVLMAACTAASATEEMISRCVALLLSRNADPNVCNRSSMTCLMLAARDGYCQLINLLVSHGAKLNFQNDNGLTALIIAVQYGREVAVLKLLQLGADKFIKTKMGKTAADMAKMSSYPEISRILSSTELSTVNVSAPSKAEALYTFLNHNPDLSSACKESSSKLSDIELLLHGLNLDHLSDIMVENDVTWSDLLIMEKGDLEKIGVTNPEDLKKILSTMELMHLDKVDLDTLMPLNNIDSGREDFLNFLISLKQQCCYLTETLQDVISRFPRSPSEVVLTCDPKKEAQALCTELVTQTGDLQKEILCLKTLLSKVDHTEYNFKLLQPVSNNGQGGKPHKRFAAVLGLGLLGAGLLFVLSQSKKLNYF